MLGIRLKEIREGQKLSQGDVERLSGLKRCYVSRVENNNSVLPSRLWRNWPARWAFQCIASSTKVTNLLRQCLLDRQKRRFAQLAGPVFT